MSFEQKERRTLVALMEINPATIAWAEQQYAQFLLPHLGKKRRLTHLMSRALLLAALQRYYDPKLTTLPELSYNQHQKPTFLSAPYLFNLSHTEDAVAVIIQPLLPKQKAPNLLQKSGATDLLPLNITIGIDLERIQPRKSFSGLLARTFTPMESAWILGSSKQSIEPSIHPIATLPLSLTAEEQKRFFLLWSSKEAYLKADGRGLQGLKSLEIDPKRAALYGDLTGGKLYAGTMPFNQKAHSVALYLPENCVDQLKISTLKIKAHQALFSSEIIKWDLILSDMPKQHTNID